MADILDLEEGFEVDVMAVVVEDLDEEVDLVREVEELVAIAKEGNV